MGDVEPTSSGDQEFSSGRCLLLENSGVNTVPGNNFGGPKPGRSTPDDSDKRPVQRLSSNIRRIGNSARLRSDSSISICGDRCSRASLSFSSVFFFMNRQSAQEQVSVGPGMKVLPGISFLKRCSIPDSVTMIKASASESRQ